MNLAFRRGVDQVAGAYELGTFRRSIAGDAYWGAKLSDPSNRYVKNLLEAMAYGASDQLKVSLTTVRASIITFVSQLLDFPQASGRRFRDSLGNLLEIVVARDAVLQWLRHHISTEVPAEMLAFPTRHVADDCLQAGVALVNSLESTSAPRRNRVASLIRLGLGASAADFNNPAFQKQMREHGGPGAWMREFFARAVPEYLSPDLGGEQFLDEFCDKYLESGDRCVLTYLPGSVSQAAISLALCREMLAWNP